MLRVFFPFASFFIRFYRVRDSEKGEKEVKREREDLETLFTQAFHENPIDQRRLTARALLTARNRRLVIGITYDLQCPAPKVKTKMIVIRFDLTARD